jgi:hypothetical protein
MVDEAGGEQIDREEMNAPAQALSAIARCPVKARRLFGGHPKGLARQLRHDGRAASPESSRIDNLETGVAPERRRLGSALCPKLRAITKMCWYRCWYRLSLILKISNEPR